MRRLAYCLVGMILLAAMILLPAPAAAWAQTPGAATAPSARPGGPLGASVETTGGEADSSNSVWTILAAGGWVGDVILLLSIAAVALAIEHVMKIRASVLMPPGLGEDVRALLASGNVAAAEERCRQQPSFLAFVLSAGLGEVESGWPAVEKAMEEAIADQSARMFRRIEYLTVIGNIAPMLGLLGTVIGMVVAFREVAETQGAARAADLAEGIYFALVTTVEGLIVAIPALGAFAVFRNRVDQFVAETAYAAQHASAPLKRRRTTRRPAGPAGPVPPPVGGRD